MSDTSSSRPATTPRRPEEEGPANTGSRWPLPEETFWSESTDPHGVAPGELTQPQPAITPDAPAPRSRGTSPEAGRSRGRRGADAGHPYSNGHGSEPARPLAADRRADPGSPLANGRGAEAGLHRGHAPEGGQHRGRAPEAGQPRGHAPEAGPARGRGSEAGQARGRAPEAGQPRNRVSEAGQAGGRGPEAGQARAAAPEIGEPRAQGRDAAREGRRARAVAGDEPVAPRGRRAKEPVTGPDGVLVAGGPEPGRAVPSGPPEGQPAGRPAGRTAGRRAEQGAVPVAAGAGQRQAATPDAGGQERPEPQQQPDKPKRKRDPFLDNVKFVLIALVPIGHSLVPTLAADSARAAYIFIYTFHMPLFVLISGYLSRNFWNSNAKTNKLVDTFLIPYVIVEVGYAALRFALGQKWSLTIIDPAWLNWYLLALLFWRLSTPVWKRMRYPVPVAIAIYLFAGFSQISGDFSMDRFFGLLPFFVIGLVMQPEHFEMLNRRWIKILSVFTVLGAAAVAIYIAPKSPLGPFYYKNSYQDLHLSWWMGLGVRTGLLICALAMCFAVLALVPRKETWYTDLGTRTLYCYLLHGIPVLIAKEMGWLSVPWLYGPLGVLAIASSCFALAIILCLAETRTLFKWVLEPRLTWLYRRPSRS
ncbi:acyltransferase family protein [Nonomuraea sp. NPDC004580]|uniref:acyltransferase family protein n=1 Tax=Nonomuraea sp. NPDC004580 TaxID=3154552 RepID=UPI00339F569C